MAKTKGALKISTEKCKGCNLCVVACNLGVLALTQNEVNRKGYNFCSIINAEACIGCASCAIVCPDACIEVYRERT